jgi:hypothetical protein
VSNNSYYVSSPALRASYQQFGLALVANPTTEPTDLPAYRSPDGQVWFGCKLGQEFGVETVVPSGRFGAIITVDGINTYTGESSYGDIHRDSGHWVMTPPSGPGKNILLGWVVPGGDSVAAFTFRKEGESYAARRGFDTANTGVVGARFWFERQDAPVLTRGLGTAYGREIKGRVSSTEFQHDLSREPVTLVVRYAEESELIAAGFIRITPNALPYKANPFPGVSKVTGCPPPPGWPR